MFLILNEHGTEDSTFGQDNKVLITKGEEILMRDKVIYTIACEVAKSLGKSIINKGGECFIGYENKFVFLMDQNKYAAPLKDEKQKNFYESQTKFLYLIKGNTLKQAFEKAKEEFRRRIIKWKLLKR